MHLDRLTASPHFYDIVYAAIFLLAAFNIFEIVFLLAHKRRIEKAEKKKEDLKRRVAAALITELSPSVSLPEPGEPAEYEAYAEAAGSIIDSFEGEVAERATRLVIEFNVDLYYRRLYRHRVWYKRAHAVDSLSSLKLKSNREFFSAVFLIEPSVAVKYRLIYGLSTLVRDRQDLAEISDMVSSLPYMTSKYNEDIFFNAITALKLAGREEEFNSFLRGIMKDESVRPLVKRDWLSACHIAAYENAAPLLKEYFAFFSDEPEVLVACVRALARMGDTSLLPEALRHADWRVRLAALKHAHYCGPEVLPDLLAMLRHKNYHVRLNAALALSKHGPEGMAALSAQLGAPDKFAADAARYALDLARSAS